MSGCAHLVLQFALQWVECGPPFLPSISICLLQWGAPASAYPSPQPSLWSSACPTPKSFAWLRWDPWIRAKQSHGSMDATDSHRFVQMKWFHPWNHMGPLPFFGYVFSFPHCFVFTQIFSFFFCNQFFGPLQFPIISSISSKFSDFLGHMKLCIFSCIFHLFSFMVTLISLILNGALSLFLLIRLIKVFFLSYWSLTPTKDPFFEFCLIHIVLGVNIWKFQIYGWQPSIIAGTDIDSPLFKT